MENNSGVPNSELKHETRDASVRTLIHWGIGLAVFLVAGLVVAYVTFRYYTTQENAGPPASPLESNVRTLPPEPRLQVNAPAELQQYLDRQNRILNSYGWVNREQGIVRIPIDRAMDLLIKKNLLHARSNAPANPLMAKPGRHAGGQRTAAESERAASSGGGSTALAARWRR